MPEIIHSKNETTSSDGIHSFEKQKSSSFLGREVENILDTINNLSTYGKVTLTAMSIWAIGGLIMAAGVGVVCIPGGQFAGICLFFVGGVIGSIGGLASYILLNAPQG